MAAIPDTSIHYCWPSFHTNTTKVEDHTCQQYPGYYSETKDFIGNEKHRNNTPPSSAVWLLKSRECRRHSSQHAISGNINVQLRFSTSILVPDMTYNVFGGTLNPTLLLYSTSIQRVTNADVPLCCRHMYSRNKINSR